MKITLLAYMATYCNAPLLARGLAGLGHGVCLIVARQDVYGFWEEYPCVIADGGHGRTEASLVLKQSDGLILLGSPGMTHLGDLPGWDEPEKKLLILSDSHFLKNPRGILSEAKHRGVRLAAMPDKLPLVHSIAPEEPCTVYRPPVEVIRRDIPLLGDTITIAHSPGKRQRDSWKGTAEVEATLDAIAKKHAHVRIDLIRGQRHEEAIFRRAEAQIFVDQCIPLLPIGEGLPMWSGGLGKSGYEAMAAGCAVLASGTAEPPAMMATPKTLFADMEGLVMDREFLQLNREACLSFAHTLHPKIIAQTVLEALT
jgi:hypothetical protein